ncbi:hypothetical protein [Peterkaempfera griseoplana]|uniref:hypothetical protein n=1 Tax=Peterkaempfera griseoplana TaxID=66896 RepID=UPI0006E40B67
MAYSFRQPDFIQPQDPFWLALTALLESAGVSEQEIPEVSAVLCAVVSGLLLTEINGALQRWSSLPPGTPSTGEDIRVAEGGEDARGFRLALDMAIAGLEKRLAAN